MADRYWVGGAGSWNSTTKWSTTSGGASGASVPTSADNAIFDASSGSGAVHYIVTVTDSSTCANLTFTPVAANGVTEFSLGTGFVIAGTFSTSGTAGNRRAWFRSSTYGLTRDMQIATIGTVTDVDFRDVRVTGAGGTLSGTRIGNLRGCSGITFSTAKIVYWNLAGAQNWSATGWATTSAGTPSTDNFPLAQDTATFTDAGSVTGNITFDAAIPYTGTVDMSARTTAAQLLTNTTQIIYGNWSNGSGTAFAAGSGTFTFSGRNTQTITSASKTFPCALVFDSYGGTVQLADAFNISNSTLTVTNGTFDTKNFNVTAGSLSSSNSNVRTITLGSSTVTLSGTVSAIDAGTITNLTFNAGTSSIVFSGASSGTQLTSANLTFYDVSFTGTSSAISATITGNNTYRNLSFTAPASAGALRYLFSGTATITGTLTCAGASVIRRIFLRSDTIGTTRTLTVATLSATDCDFRDITIAGAAAGGSPTRAGDCGGNTGITFSGAKTVYWNLAGAANWSDTAWATSSGGTPSVNNFPLAQDIAVFDNTGSVTGTITINAAWNIGTFNASARTSAMTLTTSTNTPTVYGNWLFGTGITSTSATGTITFSGQTTQTITSNGVTFGCPVTIDSSTGTAQLADALILNSARTLTLTSGTFDAVTYNVTTGLLTFTAGTLKMGSGTWTLSGTGSIWTYTAGTLYKGTANIVLSDTSTTARTFAGGSQSYNKLTIGGATGISTTTISGANQFTEIASTKTVAHTIDGTQAQTFGAWTVTGTVGNVVTISGTATFTIAGARVSGVDYLALGTTTISATSPGEFYAGANSTGGTNAILTAAPTATTRYWRGGTGTWDATTTTNWATTSGGAGPASVPTSADAVVFDTLSNATAYTVTCTATQLRCAALTMAGPATGNVTWAGTAPLAIHGNFSLPATVLTRTYTGAITFSGSSTGKTITTNGNALASATTIDGVGCGWTLASALDIGTGTFTVTNGSFATSTFNLTSGLNTSTGNNARTINFGSSTVTGSTNFTFGTTENARANLTFTAGTSQINLSATSPTLAGNNQTFYNVSTTANLATFTLTGVNTFNNLVIGARASIGVGNVSVGGNQTISGTFTLSAGTDATYRTFVQSNTLGTTRTLTCAAFAGTDADFRDITIAGAAAPVSGTRLGDCKGNSGITFGAGTTKYWNLNAGGNWGGAIGWATSSGGSPAINNFPLAQDTCLFEATGLTSGSTVSINQNYNIGTINMSARTSNTMVLATATLLPTIYGNWINGTGTSITGTGTLTFAGRTSQTITSAAVTFTQGFTINTPGGSVTLQDNFLSSNNTTGALTLAYGTFNANVYNVTFTGTTTQLNFSSTSNARTMAVGSGTWTIPGENTGAWNAATSTNLTITGTGTITLTGATAKTFAGGGLSYSGITLNQGGAGALTISGNNTFANISNTYKATGATNITLGTTTQTVGSFTASGEATRVLTLQGTSSTSPGTLVYSGSGSATSATTDYLTLTGVRAYSLATTWYAGTNSTNNGSLGWLFSATPVVTGGGGKFFLMFG
jgi:fibronectin-binding autotransporter adhesin